LSDRAVFFDPSQKRWPWIKGVGAALALLSLVLVTFFWISVSTLLVLPGFATVKKSLSRSANLPRHQTKLQQFLARKERDRLLASYAAERKSMRAQAAAPLVNASQVVAAFYAPWQETTGITSLFDYASKMTHLMPEWLLLKPDAKGLDFTQWDPKLVPHNLEVLRIAHEHNLNIVPVLNNAQLDPFGGAGDFKPERVHALLTSPTLQQNLATQIRRFLLANRYQGINIDFEDLFPGDYALYPAFLSRLSAVLKPAGLIVTVDLEAEKGELDWQAAAAAVDFVILMAYDEHDSSGGPGPIASIDWYRRALYRALRSRKRIPREKLVIGLANYAYDWTDGEPGAEPLTYQAALLEAQQYNPDEKPKDVVDFDAEKLNPTFTYTDDENHSHEVWFLDAATAANQWMIAQTYGVRGSAIWVLGSNDPSIWQFLDRARVRQPPKPETLNKIKFPYGVEFVGDGEILRVEREPKDGIRTFEIDPGTGLILDEDYQVFPTSTVIRRTGFKPNLIALTIDDGPASPYTAQMLDVLKQYNVKATFFLIGENADRYPSLVRRIWNEGHEIGNHTFTHPNIAALSDTNARLELNTMQRALQSIIGRSTLLFRPPYNADAEPTSLEEVKPIELASGLGYITVGEFIDPQDWNLFEVEQNGSVHTRNAREMLDSVLQQLGTEQGSSILLHDGGGDRSETVKLIPMIITTLRQKGYQFVTVSQLMDSNREAIMPRIKSSDTLLVADDRIVFEAIYLTELFLGIAFISAIVLGSLRVVFVTILALLERVRARREHFPTGYEPTISLLIAAFNEERVIVNTIRAVLSNDYPNLEIVVVDDGSSDATSEQVRTYFGHLPNVHLIQEENRGKAGALNRAIQLATGEILIALDADTLFARDTIRRLVRRFSDPRVGAVAGNVKVGNRINPLTYWQAIEYITSQNLDRRAYSYINAVTVVPGAVGAWRREAVLQAGGYSTDTMAEDMDLTWRIRRIGWKIATETTAIGYTEAPDTFSGLFKQRFRWAFGTLQCLWKHRRALGRYGWFGRVMLPSLWLFQVLYQALSPLVDLQIAWTLGTTISAWMYHGALTRDWQPLPSALTSLYLIAFMYAFFFVIELIGSVIAFRLDREDGKLLIWLFWQRFLYRQLMYAVLLRSIQTAASGIRAGWGKLERKGTVELAADQR
jgi:poly-beta-1,6 N-acetyl-D-glucosamine synthase